VVAFSLVIDLLIKYARTTPRDLRVNSRLWQIGNVARHESFCGSLRAFGSVKRLNLKFSLLFRHRDGHWEGPRLVDIMPASLEELSIEDPKPLLQKPTVLVELFAHFPELKKERLPTFQNQSVHVAQ